LKRKDFFFNLPENLIAQFPLNKRDTSRLMILERKSNRILHKQFHDIVDFLNEGDCLILNNTRVIPSRLIAKKKDTAAKIEIFLLRPLENNRWSALVKPAKKVKEDSILLVENEEISIIEKSGNELVVEFNKELNVDVFLKMNGKEPLPPYIKRDSTDLDKERYQTVYAKKKGAVAAPTAGLHFTKELLDSLRKKGVSIAYLTLHVGLGTFLPVKTDNVDEHRMHSEYYHLDKENSDLINSRKGRLIAVGTTSVRTIESIYQKHKSISADSGWTDIFIYPGYHYLAVDSMITNFHTPESTLIMLVSAFAGKEFVFKAYQEAIENEYRFFSYGDSMLIL
jgi:S-adenosylmethionine:tRNA ribosyltransferase-isomerase